MIYPIKDFINVENGKTIQVYARNETYTELTVDGTTAWLKEEHVDQLIHMLGRANARMLTIEKLKADQDLEKAERYLDE